METGWPWFVKLPAAMPRESTSRKCLKFAPTDWSKSCGWLSKTNRYRVGDPAFVGFSADSRQIVLHFHKLGVDRETWIETWSFPVANGNRPRRNERSTMIAVSI